MINSSRLTQPNSIATSRLASEDNKALERSLTNINGTDVPTEGLLSGGIMGVGAGALAGTSSFNELLQMSKLDQKKEVTPAKVEAKTGKEEKEDKKSDAGERKTKSEGSQGKKAATRESKGKSEKEMKETTDEQQALAQLLVPQQTQNLGIEKAAVQQNVKQVSNGETLNKNQLNAQMQQTQKIEQPKNLNDVMRNLDQKIENLTKINNQLQNNTVVTKGDELSDLASKFDDVKFDFTAGENQAAQTNKLYASELSKELQTKEMMQKLAEQEWAQNDLTLRDLVSRNALEDAAMEQMSLERLEAISRLKDSQLDKLQMQSLQNAALEKQMMVQDSQSVQQPQWKSVKDLSPEQLNMLDSMAGVNKDNAQMLNNRSQNIAGGPSVASRLMGQESAAPNVKPLMQDSVAGLQAMAAMSTESHSNNSANGNGGSFSGNTDKGSSNALTGIGAARNETGVSGKDIENDAKAEARMTREQEKAREMARSAALRAQSLASELAAKGGGTARVQIKDSQLGVVELRINMSDNNRMNVELVANSERIKQELEKQSEDLKSGLEKHKVVLEGVRFATDAKLGESNFQNSSQNDNRNQQPNQQQQQQNYNSFSQNNSSPGQQGFSQERFFEAPAIPVNSTATSPAARKSYSGKNETQTNVQRAANGSLKVSA